MKKIPDEDLKLINKAFEKDGGVQVLGKNASGKLLGASIKNKNDVTVKIQDFTGRVLKHQKSVVISNRGQLVLGVKGQKFDDVPLEYKKLAVWFDSDFE